jgi:hypothetical protein
LAESVETAAPQFGQFNDSGIMRLVPGHKARAFSKYGILKKSQTRWMNDREYFNQ